MTTPDDLLRPWLTPPAELIRLYPGPLDLEAADYSRQNARLCAWASWVVYQRNFDDIRHIIESLNLRLAGEWNQGDAQAMLIMPPDEGWLLYVFAGSREAQDWIDNITLIPVPWSTGGLVHVGFADQYRHNRQSVEQALLAFPDTPVFVTGHSLGGGVAQIAASILRPRETHTFAAPPAGTLKFKKSLADLRVYRHVKGLDPVPHLLPQFRHIGSLIRLPGGEGLPVEHHGIRGYYEALSES